MNNPYLWIAIGIILVLVAVFVITFLLNRKTPVPKGCENLRIGNEGCGGCANMDCSMKKKLDIKKIEEDIEEDKEQ